jgi:hypothetical protein
MVQRAWPSDVVVTVKEPSAFAVCTIASAGIPGLQARTVVDPSLTWIVTVPSPVQSEARTTV